MRLPDRAGCEWNGYTTWVAEYGGWVRWCSGGWYTITTRLIKLSKYIRRLAGTGPHDREFGVGGPGDLG